MFKRVSSRKRIIMFISSYIPLFYVIIIQNFFCIVDNSNIILKEKQLNWIKVISNFSLIKKAFYKVICYEQFYIALILFVIIRVIKWLLNNLLKSISNSGEIKATVIRTENVTNEYTMNYLAVYILPFITLNLATIAGIVEMIFLGYVIGYIFVKNNLLYINPTLNLSYDFYIYKCELSYKDSDKDVIIQSILLSKNDIIKFYEGKEIILYKESQNICIEK